jgi:hypothetical protein
VAGQFLPIRVVPAGSALPLIRTYTLSVAPLDGIYRLSVKREGVVSSFLHDCLREDDIIEARAPDGGLVIDAAERRARSAFGCRHRCDAAAGYAAPYRLRGLRTRRFRPTWFSMRPDPKPTVPSIPS